MGSADDESRTHERSHHNGNSAAPVHNKKSHDDLEIIEGIGPKVAEILHENGIKTFSKLADMSSDEIYAVISKYGKVYENMSPKTWPRQAALARDGKFRELESYKDKLTGGHDV
jgi:predicted flap endonuclease-1-like 5' DNA nuclease